MPNSEIVSTLDPTAWTVEHVVHVKTIRLDEIWHQYVNDVPTFVKVDVQGFEKDVVIGMGNLLDDVSCIEFESALTSFYVGQPKFHDMFELMFDHGFDLVKIKPHGLSCGGILEFNAFMVRRGHHEQPEVKFWKKINDVGSHKRIVTFGY